MANWKQAKLAMQLSLITQNYKSDKGNTAKPNFILNVPFKTSTSLEMNGGRHIYICYLIILYCTLVYTRAPIFYI